MGGAFRALFFSAALTACSSGPPPFADGRIIWEIAAANDLFVAVGMRIVDEDYNGTVRLWTSPDGESWTTGFAEARGTIDSVAFGDGRWLAVGTELEFPASVTRTNILVSTDGLAWEPRAVPPEAMGARAVAFDNGYFLVVTDTWEGNRIGRTVDGLSWEWLYQGDNWYAPRIEARGGVVVVCGDGPDIAYSTDHRNWQPADAPGLTRVRSIAATADGFFAEAISDGCFGEDPSCIDTFELRSDDGMRWTRMDGSVPPSCTTAPATWSWPAPARGELVQQNDVLVTVRCELADDPSPRRISTDGGETWSVITFP